MSEPEHPLPDPPSAEVGETSTLGSSRGGSLPGDLPSAAAGPLRPGETLGDYEVLAELGRGGMGAVYRARHLKLGRNVALKVLLPVRREQRENVERFLAEARILAQIEHHNCVSIHHVGSANGLDYIEMQLVEGKSAESLLDDGPLPVPRALRIVEQVAHALAHVHRHGVIHRDVKPANVVLAADDVVKLVDFGLARDTVSDVRLTTSGWALGTPMYMAPEQWSGRPADARTDLYALGVTFYQLLAGSPPFSGSFQELMEQHLRAAPPPLNIAGEPPREALRAVLARLLAKEPASRYQSAEELIDDLRRLQLPPAGVEPPPREKPGRVLSQHTRQPVRGATRAPRRERHREQVSALARCLAAGVIAGAITAGADLAGWLDTLELRSQDWRGSWAKAPASESPVAVVELDLESRDRLAAGGAFSREGHIAPLLAHLSDAGAAAIAIDILFLDAGTGTEDGALGAVTQWVPQAIHAMTLFAARDARRPTRMEDAPERWTIPLPLRGMLEADVAELPVPALRATAQRAGHVALSLDSDGIVRRVPLLLSYDGRVYPSLSLAAAMAALEVPHQGVAYRPGDALVLSTPDGRRVEIPVDRDCRMRVNFAAGETAVPSVPLHAVLAPAAAGAGTVAAPFRGKVVFVGSLLEGDHDRGPAPGSVDLPLVYAHALAADTILRARFVTEPGAATRALAALVTALAAALLAGKLGVVRAAAATGLLTLAYGASSVWLASADAPRLLPFTAVMLAAPVSFAAALLARHVHAERARRAAAAALERYVSPEITRRILERGEAPQLGSRRRELSLLNVTLCGFHDTSEVLEPEEVEGLLTELFDTVVEVVFRHQGTVGQFSSHGLSAFFGDPLPEPDHADKAVRCALEAMRRGTELAVRWAGGTRPLPRLGIGVHTGYVTAGNVGSSRRMQYAVLGRNVELTEALARASAGRVTVSVRTASMAAGAAVYTARDDVAGLACVEPVEREEPFGRMDHE